MKVKTFIISFLLLAFCMLPITAAHAVDAALLKNDTLGYAQGMCHFDSSIAVWSSNGVFRWQPDTDQLEHLLPGEKIPAWDNQWLCASDNVLLLLDGNSGSFYEVTDHDAILRYHLPENIFTYEGLDGTENKTVLSCIATDEAIYLLLNSFTFVDGNVYELATLSPDFASVQVISCPNIIELWMAADEWLLVTMQENGLRYPALINAQTQEITATWQDENAVIGRGYAFDATSRTLYYAADSGKVYAMQDSASSILCAYLPFKTQYTTDQALLWDAQTYAYLSDGALFLRQLQPQGIQSTVLNIMGSPDPQILLRFAAEHPEISINLQEGTGDLLALQQTLLTAGNSVDLYMVPAKELYADIREKGYAAPLNLSDVLMEEIAHYYPWAQDVLMKNGQLLAIPAAVSIDYWTLNQTQWEEQHLGDIPSTMSEVFDLLKDWQESNVAAEGYYCFIECIDGVEGMLQNIIRQYLLAHEDWRAPVNFDTPEFREVTQATLDARDELYSSGEQYPLLMDYAQYFCTGRNDEDIVVSILPPTLTVAAAPAVRGKMDLLVMSAASEHPQEAISFLEFYLTNLGNIEKYMLDKDCTEPLRPVGYEANQLALLTQITETQAQLDAADGTDAIVLTDKLEQLQKRQQRSEATAWDISPEDIAIYQTIAPHVVIPLRTIYPDTESAETANIDHLIHRVVADNLSIDNFVKALNELARMIFYEQQ